MTGGKARRHGKKLTCDKEVDVVCPPLFERRIKGRRAERSLGREKGGGGGT